MVSNSQMTDAIKLSPQFEAENPGIHLKFVTLPENQARAKITMSTATGDDTFDVVMISNYETPQWAESRASAWMTSTFVSPCSATSSRAIATWTGSTSSPTTRPRGPTRLASNSRRAASDVDRALSLSGADSVQ